MTGRSDGAGVIVTGGSSGIGRAAALLFVAEGAGVADLDTFLPPADRD